MVFMVDPHVHSVFRSFEDFEALSIAGLTDVVSVAFYPVTPSSPATLVDHFRHILEAEPERFSGLPLKVHSAVGIHPRCIPRDVKPVLEYMVEVVGRCVAVGEIGLETASDLEIEVLERQLRLCKEEDVPAIVHTPRKNKKPVTDKVINVVKRVGYFNILIDHVNTENIELVENLDVHIGLTVQRGKLNPETLLQIVEQHVTRNPEKFLLDTDLGREPSDLFSLPKAVQFLRVKGVDRETIELISSKNATSLFKL